MDIKISTSKYVVVDSGSVIVPEDEYVEFTIDNLRFRFIFSPNVISTDVSDSEVMGTIKNDSIGDYMELAVHNYNHLFSTTSDFLNVGKIDGKQLYVMFSVTPMKSDGKIHLRIMNYSWYKEK